MKKEEMMKLVNHLITEDKWNEFLECIAQTGKVELVISVLNPETGDVSAGFLGKNKNLVGLITDMTSKLIEQKPLVGLYLATQLMEKTLKQVGNHSTDNKQNMDFLPIFNMMNNEDNIPN